MDIIEVLARELSIRPAQAEAAVKLIDEGNTIPFIARYRKEVTGSLNDEVLRNLYERLTYLRNLEEKKLQVLSVIEEQGKLTKELQEQILQAATLVAVEDLYRPYRPSGAHGLRWRKKKVWNLWRPLLCSRCLISRCRRLRLLIFLKKRGLSLSRMRWMGREILSQR